MESRMEVEEGSRRPHVEVGMASRMQCNQMMTVWPGRRFQRTRSKETAFDEEISAIPKMLVENSYYIQSEIVG